MEKISVVIPAHNECRYIGKCLSSIRVAEHHLQKSVEIVVCLNRCTDNTEAIAKAHGAITVTENVRNIARIRNAGINAASGDIIVNIDADSWMSPGLLKHVAFLLGTGRFVGGGISLKPERLSLGIAFVTLLYRTYRLITGCSGGGAYWFHRTTFEAIGGFDEHMVSAETLAFSKALKTFGKHKGLKVGYIRKETIHTSTRKFDQLGDWYLFKNTSEMYRGKNQQVADKVWYDADR